MKIKNFILLSIVLLGLDNPVFSVEHVFDSVPNQLFLNHFDSLKLYEEKIIYLNQIKPKNLYTQKEIQVTKLKTYNTLEKFDSALVYYAYLNTPEIIQQQLTHNYIHNLLIHNKLDTLQSFLASFPKNDTLDVCYQTLLDMLLNKHPDSINQACYNIAILKVYEKYYSFPHKSKTVSILLSSVVPGAGKWYLGDFNDGKSAFFFNLAAGSLFAESAIKLGVFAPRSWVFGAGCLYMYTSNIYGTYKLYNKQQLDLEKELHFLLASYYYNTL